MGRYIIRLCSGSLHHYLVSANTRAEAIKIFSAHARIAEAYLIARKVKSGDYAQDIATGQFVSIA